MTLYMQVESGSGESGDQRNPGPAATWQAGFGRMARRFTLPPRGQLYQSGEIWAELP